MWWLVYLYIFLFSFALAYALVPLCRRLARVTGFMSQPHPDKMGEEAVPLLGGLAIYAAFVLTVTLHYLALALVKNTALVNVVPAVVIENIPGVFRQSQKLLAFLFGGLFIFGIGLIDDRWNMRPILKLGFQAAVALFMVINGIRITFFVMNVFISSAATVIWIVVIINAFNFLDNMDGLCAGVAAIAALFFFFVSSTLEEFFISLMLIILAGSALGFLKYNFSPASIYLGDAGSMFIGYVMAVLTIMATFYSREHRTIFPVILPIIVLALPLYDMATVILMRMRRKIPVYKASPHHFSFRLLSLGMNQRGATLLIYLITFCIGIAAVLLPRVKGSTGAILILIQTMAILVIIALLERYGRNK